MSVAVLKVPACCHTQGQPMNKPLTQYFWLKTTTLYFYKAGFTHRTVAIKLYLFDCKADGQVSQPRWTDDLCHDDDDDDSFHCHYVYVVYSIVVIECLGPLVYKLQIASVESHFTKRTLIVSCVCILNDLEILNCIFF